MEKLPTTPKNYGGGGILLGFHKFRTHDFRPVADHRSINLNAGTRWYDQASKALNITCHLRVTVPISA